MDLSMCTHRAPLHHGVITDTHVRAPFANVATQVCQATLQLSANHQGALGTPVPNFCDPWRESTREPLQRRRNRNMVCNAARRGVPSNKCDLSPLLNSRATIRDVTCNARA